jgi:agarase
LFLLGLGSNLVPLATAQTRYFRVENRGGVWWIIDPNGLATLSIGANHIAYEGDRIRGIGRLPYQEAVEKKYPDRNTWGLATLARLRMWGFNTIGAWSDAELWDRDIPYTILLDSASRPGADWQHGKPVDVYDPRFEEAARQIAVQLCAPRAHDRFLIGYFSDNELRWEPDWRGKETLLDVYLTFPAAAPGRQQAVDFLRRRYRGDIRKLNLAWDIGAKDFDNLPALGKTNAYWADAEGFLEMVATRYFQVCAQAIHSADPNHLYLGARFAGRVPEPILKAARAADVVSVSVYEFDPRPLVKRGFEVTGKPVLVTEFAFRAEDSGLPNTRGAGPRVPDQRTRAKAYHDYINRLMSLPEVVGYHWFKWADQPKEGRFDGENSNYGLVNIRDEPYQEFIEEVKRANQAAFEVHRNLGK